MGSDSTARRLPVLNHARLGHYFDKLCADIREPLPRGERDWNAEHPVTIAESVFRTISSRRYCYLSRSRSAIYRDLLVQAFTRDISSGQPIHIYYDIGGGYHAGINPNELSPKFEPGLGELLIVRQISLLAQEICLLYRQGIRFTLVIDNLCALLVNDIPLEKTEAFVDKLRSMLQYLGSPVEIDALVESEHFSPSAYVREFQERPDIISADIKAITNVSRFLGRPCSAREASGRIAAYEQVSTQTDRNINSLIDGIRMTQRATPQTFPFRPFPGSDSRIQTGELALIADEQGNCKPTLITTENFERWRLFELDLELEIDGRPVPVLVGAHL